MKSSQILTKAFHIYNDSWYATKPSYKPIFGLCTAVLHACNGEEKFADAIMLKYVAPYRDKHRMAELYWWHVSDRATRLSVLQRAIADAEANND